MTSRLPRTWRAALTAVAALAIAGAARAEQVPPQSQMINEELAKSWTAVGLKPSKKASDFEFVRRAFIDLVGRIPTAEEARDFAEADSGSDKRARLVQRLLFEKDYKPKFSERVNPKDPKSVVTYDYASEYARHFANVWRVWLMTRGGVAELYHDSMELWLEEQFYKNTPWDVMVKQLLTATGKTNDNGAAAFVMAHLGEAVPKEMADQGKFDAVPITSRVTRLFLGIQTNCIQCHDHPFNPEWKQDNFWKTNAFFRQVDRDGTPAPREGNGGKKKMTAVPVAIRDNPELHKDGILSFERRSGILAMAKPDFLPNLAELEQEGAVIPRRQIPPGSSGRSRREILADYLVKHDNFAKAYVNRMWAHFFGRGMNELPAADDFGGHNKVVHPDLLNKLADEFVKAEYDTKKLISWICNSDAYSLTYQANGLKGKASNATDEAAPYFTRMGLKSMSPEVLFDSLETATRLDMAPDKDAKKAKKDAWMDKLTRNFGDDEGNEVTFNGTIIQALLMMNGPELNSEVSRKDGTSAVDKAMAKHKGNEMAVIADLYLMALSRRPSSTIAVTIPRIDPKTGKQVGQDTSNEAAFLARQVAQFRGRARGPQDWKAFYEDVFWSLLNSSEFILNH
jgi:hypothetical protein